MPVPRSYLALAIASLWLGAAPSLSHAALVLSVQNSSAPVGGVGSFDVLLTDTGGFYQVAGFSVDLTVTMASGVKFTAANTNTTTDPYIYGTLQSPPFVSGTFSPYGFIVSDSPQSAPGYVTLNSGDVYGLEHVTYSVSPGTALGPVTVTVADVGGGTSLSDLLGNPIPFTATNGTITVTPASVPEPSSLCLLATALIGTSLIVRRRSGKPAC